MHGLVELLKISPKISLDLRYATANNFFGKQFYSAQLCLLQKTTAERLHRVETALRKRGLGLKVFDGYRPLSVTKQFWEILPDPRYCADPKTGSKHNRGASVDLTLIDSMGCELSMPSDFDEMNERAHLDYQDGPEEALENRQILQEAMIAEGFLSTPTEWWHFDDPDWKNYPILDIPLDEVL